MTHKIKILQFNPLRLEFPDGAKEFDGKVTIVLPEFEFVIGNMFEMFPEMGQIKSNGEALSVEMTLGKPVSTGELTDMIIEMSPVLEEVHVDGQEIVRKVFRENPINLL